MSKQSNVIQKEITKDTKIIDIMYINPKAADMLLDTGFHCIGCPMSMAETIEEGCMVHGMSKREMNALIKELNKREK